MQLAMPRCHFLQSTVGSVPKGRILCERWPVGSKGGVRPGGRWRGWSSVNQPKTTGLRSHRCSPGLGGSVPAAGLGGCISVTGPQLAKPLPCEDQDPLGRNLPPPTVTPSAPSPVTSRGSGSIYPVPASIRPVLSKYQVEVWGPEGLGCSLGLKGTGALQSCLHCVRGLEGWEGDVADRTEPRGAAPSFPGRTSCGSQAGTADFPTPEPHLLPPPWAFV